MVAALLAVPTVAACGSGDTHDSASRSLGRVPVATAPTAEPTSTAAPGKPAVLDVGAPVLASLGGGSRATLTLLGPEQSTDQPGAKSTDGTFTLKVVPVSGATSVDLTDVASRNETGQPVTLHATGPTSARATPARPATLRFTGHYGSGAAQVTYSRGGKPVAVWDFDIELD